MQTQNRLILFAFGAVVATGCGEDIPPPLPPSTTTDVAFDLGIKGYSSTPSGSGSFGVASTESDARLGRDVIGGGKINWLESGGGKTTKSFVLSQRAKGEKLWVFVAANRKPLSGQSVTVTWPAGHTLSVTSATDSLVVTSFTVGN